MARLRMRARKNAREKQTDECFNQQMATDRRASAIVHLDKTHTKKMYTYYIKRKAGVSSAISGRLEEQEGTKLKQAKQDRKSSASTNRYLHLCVGTPLCISTSVHLHLSTSPSPPLLLTIAGKSPLSVSSRLHISAAAPHPPA